MAPKRSSWGTAYATWARALDIKTHGEIRFAVSFNGVEGSDDTMLANIKQGKLDGAVVSSIGLAQIYKNVRVLQLPGVATTWTDLETVRNGLRADFDTGFKRGGFSIVSWSDIGMVHLFTKNFEARHPQDLKNRNLASWTNGPTEKLVLLSLGNFSTMPGSGIPAFFGASDGVTIGPPPPPALAWNKLDAISAPNLVSSLLSALQFDHIDALPMLCEVSALVVKSSTIDSFPADLRATVDALGQRMNTLFHTLDDERQIQATRRAIVVHHSTTERQEWSKLLRKSVVAIPDGIVEKSMISKALAIRGLPALPLRE